jgi:exodeoxyribonuclease VII small subunit
MPVKQDQPFEDLYHRLEETVGKLEKGGLSLEQSIALYEEGMDLAKRCQDILDGAELRITKLRESFVQPSPPQEGLEEEQEAFSIEDD